MEQSREFYEQQGAQAYTTGSDILCSERSITEVVIRMLLSNRHRFESILDVGCGANLDYDFAIAEDGKRVHGIDFTMNFLSLAPRHPRVSLAQADATMIPYRDASFDAVVCSETIEHIRDDARAIREIARVLKPTGLFVMTVPNLWNADRLLNMVKSRNLKITLMEGHIREYSRGDAGRLISPFFIIERWIPVGFGWSGKVGGRIEYLVHSGLLRFFSKSIAFVARKR